MDNQDPNIVEIWLRKDPIRWIAGILGGLFAGAVALVCGMILVALCGGELWYPVKVMALPLLGSEALAYSSGSAIVVGLITHGVLCAVLGGIFAHFTGTNSISALLGVGVTWGAFSWIFINNLFSKSWHSVLSADISAGGAFAVCMAYGVALVSVSFFDRMLRRR